MIYSSARYIAGVIVGGGMAFLLLFAMQYLIATGQTVNQNDTAFRFLPYVRVQAEETVNVEDRRRQRPPAPEPQPLTQTSPNNEMDPLVTTLVLPPPAVDPGSNPKRRQIGVVDGTHMPLFKAAPDYPERARRRGIQGHCTVEYTISSLGTVVNPSVVSCSDAVFERASIKAALKFKYRPRIVNGQAVAVAGQRNRFMFELD